MEFIECRYEKMIYVRKGVKNKGPLIMFLGHSPPPKVGSITRNNIRLFLDTYKTSNFVMMNLFSLSSPVIKHLVKAGKPWTTWTDDLNDEMLIKFSRRADLIVCAWGGQTLFTRPDWITANLPQHKLFCIKLNPKNRPYHYKLWRPSWFPSRLHELPQLPLRKN